MQIQRPNLEYILIFKLMVAYARVDAKLQFCVLRLFRSRKLDVNVIARDPN